ncbi:hypothetical protein Sjap_005815 [Stephania japonica]|uniref:Protein kinase domain-containing protein n=1 Tax=Stephania japonica TaxID=461633 RepID=A0AAP0PJ61_9MAGN
MAHHHHHYNYFFFFFMFILLLSLSTSKKLDQLDGPLSNVTKHLIFADFAPKTNPRIYHDVKLLGSAKLSDETNSIQIPDPSNTHQNYSTNFIRHQAGRALFSSPIRLLDPLSQSSASFHTTFSFQFTTTGDAANGNGADATIDGGGGSGLTFIIVPDEFTVGRPGPWLAMMNDACDHNYKAIAIEFDTRMNTEFGDPSNNHVGINLGTIVSKTTANASDVGVNLRDGSVHRAWISYDGDRKWIDIHLGNAGSSRDFPVKAKPLVSAQLDLSPYLNEYMFVGFSASTGNHTQIHHVFDWNFSSTSRANLRVPSMETCEKNLIFVESNNKPPQRAFMIFIAVVVVLFLAALLSLHYNGKRRRVDKSVLMPEMLNLSEKKHRPRPPNKPRRFTFAELAAATRGFSEGEILSGDSVSGVLYRGMLGNGSQVAVNRFSTRFLSSNRVDRRRVVREIGAATRVRHPNLAGLRGWCCDNKEVIVVYDYYQNGSLDRWLFGLGVLPWTRRVKVVRDVAEAVSFLHSKKLAHKNVKTSSVFLDVTFRAILGDFGFGCLPVESGRVDSDLSLKADVFEFGIVVLEIVAGRSRNSGSDTGKVEEMDLLKFAWSMHEKGELLNVVDQRIGAAFNPDQAVRVLKVGLLCTVSDVKSRPSMNELVRFLSLEIPVPDPPPGRPIAMFPYNSATDLCTGYTCTPFK